MGRKVDVVTEKALHASDQRCCIERSPALMGDDRYKTEANQKVNFPGGGQVFTNKEIISENSCESVARIYRF